MKIERRSFWQWLTRAPRKMIKMATRFDESAIFITPREPLRCAWCSLGWLEHTVEAHRVQLVKHELRQRALTDPQSRLQLESIEQAELEFK